MRVPQILEIRLRGPDIAPETVSVSALAELLPAIERAARSMMAAREQANAEHLIVSLVDVSPGSCVLGLSSNQPEVAQEALLSFSRALSRSDLSGLPREARSAAIATSDFARKRNLTVELGRPRELPIATVTPDTEFVFKTPHVRGETVLYGVVERVGGKDPRIRLTLDDGTSLSCLAHRSLVKQAGSHLYERIGLQGRAEWDSADWSVIDFVPQGLVTFSETPIDEAIMALAQASGDSAWADEPDVIAAVRALREEN